MKTLLLIILFVVLTVQITKAECLMNCAFQPGTTCINNECVTTPTPTPEPLSKGAEGALLVIKKLYCDTQVCIIVITPELLKSLDKLK